MSYVYPLVNPLILVGKNKFGFDVGDTINSTSDITALFISMAYFIITLCLRLFISGGVGYV